MCPRAVVLALLSLSLLGCHRSSRRMVASPGPDEKLAQGRLLALGARVPQGFFATDDRCIRGGSGKLDLNIDCLPNIGTPVVDSVTIDDPTVASLTQEPLSRAPQASLGYVLRALRVGKTTVRARAHVGLTFSSFVIPIEVVVPDRVTISGLGEPILAGDSARFTARVLAGTREVETEGLEVLTVEGAGALDPSRGGAYDLRTREGHGGPVVLRSRFDPTFTAQAQVFAKADLAVTLEVLPGKDCGSRRVVPHFHAGPRELTLFTGKGIEAGPGLKPFLFVTTPRACTFVDRGVLNESPGLVERQGGLVRRLGSGACVLQVGLRELPQSTGIIPLLEHRLAFEPCTPPAR